jgi:hypothetical protein
MNATMSRPATKRHPLAPRTAKMGRARRLAPSRAAVDVILPAGVLDRLRVESLRSGLGLEWLVAAFVAALAE